MLRRYFQVAFICLLVIEEPEGTFFLRHLLRPFNKGRQILRTRLTHFKSATTTKQPSRSKQGGVAVSAGSSCPFSGSAQCKLSGTSRLPEEKRRRELVDFFESTTLDIIASVGPEKAGGVLEQLNQKVLQATHISTLCPRRRIPCEAAHSFRQSDGTCNNLDRPTWGSVGECERRILPPNYGDGVSSPRSARSGRALPSARLVSLLVHDGTGRVRDVDERVTHLSVAFGQFLAHDLGFIPFVRLPPLESKMGGQPGDVDPVDMLPIPVPDKDPLSSRFHQSTVPFFRSLPCLGCRLGFREQANSRTSYADMSPVYGVSAAILTTLRLFRGGLLKSRTINGSEVLPPSTEPLNDNCSFPALAKICFRTGDFRCNEHTPLLLMHTIWLREHNRIARSLAARHPSWNDERLFQTTRRIVEAEYQHVVYNEFLPALLGEQITAANNLRPLGSGFTQYDKSVDATSINEFATAAFRFMHSNIDGEFLRLSASGERLPPRELDKEYFQLFDFSAVQNSVLRGLLKQPVRKFGRLGDRAVTQMLFRHPDSPFGLDLFAIDIERGRDHGTPPYAEYARRLLGISLRSFEDLHRHKLMPRDVAELYADIYEDVHDVDLFSAGMSEHSLPDASVGRTFAAIIAEQFRRLKEGDRFYYEHRGQAGSFNEDQLNSIRSVTFASVICENSQALRTIQRLAFLLPSDNNPVMKCSELQRLDLSFWDDPSAVLQRHVSVNN
ncbi:salivary peroxidase/catechol oxidase-like [Amblyomma americanum]